MKESVAGQSKPLNFLLDSGAGATVLDSSAARRCGLTFGRPEEVQGMHGHFIAHRIEGLSANVGGVPIARSVIALDLRSAGKSCGGDIDGIVGADFFRGRIVQIDYAAGKVRILNREELHASGEILPLSMRNGAMCVRVRVNRDSAKWMRIDTGCNSAVECVATDATTKKVARWVA